MIQLDTADASFTSLVTVISDSLAFSANFDLVSPMIILL